MTTLPLPGRRFRLPRRARFILAGAMIATGLPTAFGAEGDLLRAVERGDAEGWRSRLRHGSEVATRDEQGNTALHLAALNHDMAAVEALLEAGAAPDAENTAGATPLLYGAGHAGVVEALLARRVDPNHASAAGIVPLMAAVSHPESYDAARLLVAAGAGVQARNRRGQQTILALAVDAGDRRTVDFLLAQGAAKDPDAAALALTAAAANGDVAVVELMLAYGADPNRNPDFAGHAFNTALLMEQLPVARLLLEHGADPHLRSPRGPSTPPMVWAAYNQSGDPSIVQALIARGADLHATDLHGATALTYALRSGSATPVVRYLEDAGAKSPPRPRVKRSPDRAVPEAPAARAAMIRERMPAALALLQQSSNAFLANGFVQQANCTSCHGQDLPAIAYDLARKRGFQLDEISVGRQIGAQLSRWNDRAENARQMTAPVPGSPVTLAYGLFGLRAHGHAADKMTDAMVRYILRTQHPDGYWADTIRRPPMEDGIFVSTAWVALAVRDYAPAALEQRAAESQARSARWIARQQPSTNNEVVFQLLGLHWSGVPRDKLSAYADRVIAAQRPDGGWAQLPGLESDAWATGSALYALHEAGCLLTTDTVYQRGVTFLLRTQFEDGSWWVRSRSWPFQPHFNGQFPHGRDQWISQAATAWAATALLLALEPVSPPVTPPSVKDLVAAYTAVSPAAKPKKAAPGEAAVSAELDFARDIQPIFKRSCADCHGGARPRGEFNLATREGLLKGGASGEPAIMPGYSDDSVLIQYVTGKIEDLEMPPLDRRDEFPALTAAEIELLRTWIDAGAPSSAGGPAPTKL